MKIWRRECGGCSSTNVRYPCSNIYLNRKTGQLVSIYVTPKRHCKLPLEVSSLKEILNLKGVCKNVKSIDDEDRVSRIDKMFSKRKKVFRGKNNELEE